MSFLMRNLSSALLYAAVVWLAPFLISFLVFPIHESNRPLFESVMAVALSLVTVVCAVRYLARVPVNAFGESVQLGLLFLAVSLALDAPFFLGMMNTPLLDYLADIGVTYLIIPVITGGLGYLQELKTGA